MHDSHIYRAALVLALSLGGGVAHAQRESVVAPTAPDSSVRAELGARLSRHPIARVQTRDGWLEVTQPRFADRAGLMYLAARPVGSEIPVADLPRPLPLAEISQIQLQTSAAGHGALIGGMIAGGFALLRILPLALACDDAGAGDLCGSGSAPVIGAVLIVGAGGSGLGAMVGASVKRWTTVYMRE